MNLLKSGGQVNWRPIFFLLITVCFSWLIGVPQVLMADDQAYSGWQSFQTEYTQIIFEPHNIAYAEDLAGFADGLFEEVSEMVGWKPEKRVPVVLTDRTALANGFYRPLPHSITLFLTSPGDRFLGARSQNWLQSLYVHELVHYIHLTERLGLPGLASYVFGPDAVAANTALMPVWWIEGLAVWAESNLLAGGRGDSPVFNSLWQAPLMEGKMWSRKQMRYQSAYNPLGRVYVSGYLVVDYLVDRYGIEVFRQINKRFIWFPLLGIECAVKHVTGDSLRLAYMRMQGRKRFELRERDFAGQEGNALATQAGSTHREWHVPYSAGDTLLTYSEGTHATAGFVDAKAPSVTLFETGWLSDSLSYSFSRDGRRAVFARISGDYGHSSGTPNIIKGNSDIFLLDMTAGSYEYKKLTHGQRLYQPSISADGSVIVAIELEGDSYRLVKIE
ncbi:MAG: hypothetical protein D6B26_06065, partial [Spirochaetaceae bacterium]